MHIVNDAEALARLDGEREIYAELITAFLQDSQNDMDQLRDAVSVQNYEKTAYHAHKIKGAALTLGAELLSLHAENLEQASRKGEKKDFNALFSDMQTAYTAAVERLVELFNDL